MSPFDRLVVVVEIVAIVCGLCALGCLIERGVRAWQRWRTEYNWARLLTNWARWTGGN